MPIWFQGLLAAFSFASELLKFLRERNEGLTADHVAEMKRFTLAMSKARKDGDTSEIENRFKSLGLPNPKLPDDPQSPQG